MHEKVTKDGIYRIELTNSNPYARYLLVKTYGDEQKRKRMCSIEDCKQQVAEWDDDYSKIDPCFRNRGLRALFPKKEKTRAQTNYYSVYDKYGNLYMQGFGSEIAERFGCKSKTVCNAANTEGRMLRGDVDGKKGLYNVCKIDQPESEWIISGGVCWD